MALIPRPDYEKTAVIASSGTTSAAIDLGDDTLVGIIFPAAFTGTAVSLQMSDAIGGTYVTVQDGDGADLSLVATASKYVPINNLALTKGLRFIKIVSNDTEAAERTLILARNRVA